MQTRDSIGRRRFLWLAALGGGAAALLAACGAAPAAAPASPPAAAPAAKPTEPPKAADAAPKVAEPAAKAVVATPTEVPRLAAAPQAAGTTKLLMRVHWEGLRFNDFQVYINKYNETQGPQDKIYIALERFVAGQAGPIGTFIADFQAGTQEDIYHLSDGYLADLASRGFFSPPPKEIVAYIKENYIPLSIESGTWEGQIMGHPTENQPHMIFLNKKMFTEAGLDAEKSPPKTWDDLRRMAKQLTKKDAAGAKTQAGWIYHNNPGDNERTTVQRLMFQFLAGAPLVDTKATPPKWDVTSEAARQYTEFLYNTCTVDGSGSQDMGPQQVLWGARKGAIVSHDAWAVIFHLLRQGEPGVLEEQHTIPVMSPDGAKTGNMSRNYHFLVSSKSKYKEMAWKHLEWLNNGPNFYMQDYMTNGFGFVPSVKNYPMPKLFPEQMKTAFVESMKTPYQTGLPIIKGMAEALNILRDNTDALILGKATTKEFTDKVDAELKKAMESAYAK